MNRPQFHHPLRPFTAAWLAGEITALQSLEMQYRAEIQRHTAILRDCWTPGNIGFHRRERAKAYGKLRALRKRRMQ